MDRDCLLYTSKHFFSPVIIDAANVQQVEYTQINDIFDLTKTDINKRVCDFILIDVYKRQRLK